MWADVFSLKCQWFAGSLLSLVCRPAAGEMARAKVLAFTVFLFLTVHGNAVVARVKFNQTSFVVREGPQICLGVINELHDPESPPTERILVTASIDKTLFGINNPGTQFSSVHILPNTSDAQLCFFHIDDNITCEAPIIGNVQLLSSPVVSLGTPFSVQVTVMDDDATEVSFMETSYTYKEGGLLPSQSLPMIKICKKQSDVTLSITGSHLSYSMIQPSLDFTERTLVATNLSLPLPLQFTDDDIALETLEVVKLELNFVSMPEDRCDNVNIVPNKTANIYIEDDDVATMSFAGSEMEVRESDGLARACVTMSHVIARPIEFELVPQSDSAEAGIDFSTFRMTGRFEAMSNNRSICFDIPVFSDDLVEADESFLVSLRLKTRLSPGLRDGLMVDQTQLRVTITDSSSCLPVDLVESKGEKDSSVLYISQQKSVCFSCGSTPGSSPSMELFWLFGDTKLLTGEDSHKGRVFPNGTFIVYNSSDAFNTENATRITCVNNSENLESQNSIVYLGTAPANITLSYKNSDSDQDLTLTCSYSGSPQPRIEWLRDNGPLPERTSNNITVHKSTSTFDTHLTLSIQPGQTKHNYSCVASNQFGISSRSILISVRVPETGSTASQNNSSPSMNIASHTTLFMMVLCHIVTFTHLIS